MIVLSPYEVAVYYTSRVPYLRQQGKRWRGRCPIHHGKGYNFSVDPGTGLWRCWSGCGRGGDVIGLEMTMTGAAWINAVKEIEQIVGRPLLGPPASYKELRALAERHAREQSYLRDAEAWRIATAALAEEMLERLPQAIPERYAPTQLLLKIRCLHGAALLAVYRDWIERDPRLTAGLVYAGARARQRLGDRLARFIVAGAKVNNAA